MFGEHQHRNRRKLIDNALQILAGRTPSELILGNVQNVVRPKVAQAVTEANSVEHSRVKQFLLLNGSWWPLKQVPDLCSNRATPQTSLFTS